MFTGGWFWDSSGWCQTVHRRWDSCCLLYLKLWYPLYHWKAVYAHMFSLGCKCAVRFGDLPTCRIARTSSACPHMSLVLFFLYFSTSSWRQIILQLFPQNNMFLEMLKCPLPPLLIAESQVAPVADASTGAAEGGTMILTSVGVIGVQRLHITTHPWDIEMIMFIYILSYCNITVLYISSYIMIWV